MKIAVINTGGTISCVGDPLAPMSAKAFAQACEVHLNPILKQQFPDLEVTYITDVVFPESKTETLDSTNLQPSDWCIMAKGILDNYADFDGFVVLHGTDSMDFTGAALPFLLNKFDEKGYGLAVLSKPVVITGSQVPMYCRAAATGSYYQTDSLELTLNFNTDAYQNFCGAIASACTGIPEVCVYFQNHLYRSSRVLKTNASEFNAFSSPNYPALASYGVELTLYNENWLPGPVHESVSLDNADVLAAQQAIVDYTKASIDNFPVMQLNAFPAKYTVSPASAFIADLIGGAVEAGAKGIILESYGEGNFPSGSPDEPASGAIYQALDRANRSGINIVDCTQVIAGTVNNSAYASGAWLPQVGALAPADMSPIAALAKLMILMTSAKAHSWTHKHVQTLLQTDLAGEMKAVNRLDSRTNAVLQPGQLMRTLDGSAILINHQVRGPVLIDPIHNTPLWSMLSPDISDELPGRLVIQNDGNLVFYSRYNKALWATNTGNLAGASSTLMLNGHYDENSAESTLRLEVYNYSDRSTASVLYPNASSLPANSLSTADEKNKPAVDKERKMSRFKYSGRVTPGCSYHDTVLLERCDNLAPKTITPPNSDWGRVAQYGSPIKGESSTYNPAGNCDGSFMSYKNQPNNNCYAYGTNIATNTFPQPGRASEDSVPWSQGGMTVRNVARNAELDGLILLRERTIESLIDESGYVQGSDGHFVALVFSYPEQSFEGDPSAHWGGDYHWVRADNVDSVNKTISWSQKDGGDQVTNFDFAGHPISDPASACWKVNLGPASKGDTNDMIVEYEFMAYMWVPSTGVKIL